MRNKSLLGTIQKANEVIEDHSQVETGWNGIFVGVNDDGNGGDDASNKFIKRRLFQQLKKMYRKIKKMLPKSILRSSHSKRYSGDTSGLPSAIDGGDTSLQPSAIIDGGDTSLQPSDTDGGDTSLQPSPNVTFVQPTANDGDRSDDEIDTTSMSLMWWRDSLKHSCGDFSCAAIQANQEMQDQCQVETGMNATFVGVYDGHCGPQAAMFIKENLFHYLINMIQGHGAFSDGAISGAIKSTEDAFLAHVEKTHEGNPWLPIIGSGCLVGVIWKGTLYIANVGDSGAVIFSVEHNRSDKIIPEQLTTDHNPRNKAIREKLPFLHPNEQDLVVKDIDRWSIKGVIHVSRSVGDLYLKRPGFTIHPSLPQKYHFPEPLKEAVLTAEPSMFSRALTADDKFIIFASRSFWDLVPKDTASQIVWTNPRAGIARRLIKAALKAVIERIDLTFEELKMVKKENRHHYHDDITVVVIYLDTLLLGIKDITVPVASIKSFMDSEFKSLEEMM